MKSYRVIAAGLAAGLAFAAPSLIARESGGTPKGSVGTAPVRASWSYSVTALSEAGERARRMRDVAFTTVFVRPHFRHH